ncbi:acyl-CoA dehydrogenase family protein [Paracoccus jeotgali]|uniref:Acyl-CoA dehydrogenase n=1 Tax=Paracoccus jeotgali TaxID=2065379 RepID=A0A2K9MI76_9RHOB|nr:acyl-CoA dehydrogenase [Paracoccus jeotgali]AUM75338.1 acyl-CoA dehydrogenase [Paracoccus jeotgali]
MNVPTPPLRPSAPTDIAELCDELFAAAADEERGTRPIAHSIDLLRRAGALTQDGASDLVQSARLLMRIGAANLPVGRLFEGHMNALRLIRLYGSDTQQRSTTQLLDNGGFFGVWGADGPVPATLKDSPTPQLDGSKNFASGLGTVTHALVTVNSGPEVRLALIDVTDPARADLSGWNMLGMQATASGSYDFAGLPAQDIEWIGVPGDYLQEPHFVGGVWRIAALQAGAAAGLLDQAAATLRQMGRMQAEAQKTRLMTALMQVWAGMALTERAAQASVAEGPAERIVSTSISARLLTEEAALGAIKAVEQSLGLRHFDSESTTGRMARDLSVYLRQAARDAFLQRAADHALGQDGTVWGVFD